MEARFSLAVRFAHPPLETPIPALACRPAVRGPRSALRIAEGGQPRQRPRRGARLVTFNPDTDQIAREIVALLQTVERLASQKLLRDLTLKFDAVRAIPDHELSSFESPACRSNVKSAHVPPRGPLHAWVSSQRKSTPEPFNWISRRSPLWSTTSPRRIARLSPS